MLRWATSARWPTATMRSSWWTTPTPPAFSAPTVAAPPRSRGVADRVDILTSTLGKALGGASGGFTSGRQAIIDLLPATFPQLPVLQYHCPARGRRVAEGARHGPTASTSYASSCGTTPTISAGACRASASTIVPGEHPIVPIMLRDELKTVELAQAVNERGIFVVGFSYPVVPRGAARIRVQLSAAHTREQLDRAVAVFAEVGPGGRSDLR